MATGSSATARRIDGDDLVFDPEAAETRADPEMGDASLVDGVWPSSAWLVLSEFSGSSKLYHWTSQGWRLFRTMPNGTEFAGTSPWAGGRRLALFAGKNLSKLKFVIVAGDARMPVPVAQRTTLREDRPHPFDTGADPESLLAFPSGEVFVAGDYPDSGYAVEMWTASSRVGKVVAMQGPDVGMNCSGEDTNVTLFGSNPRNVYAAFPACLGHFDGEEWRQVDGAVTGKERILKASLLNDGTVWLLMESEHGVLHLRRRGPGAAWVDQITQLPDEFVAARIVSAWERDKGDLWVIVNEWVDNKTNNVALLHTRRPTKAVVVTPHSNRYINAGAFHAR
jgi:hypothetical protein